MVLLPLGLGTWLKKFPVLTLLIVLVNLYYSAREFPVLAKLHEISISNKEKEALEKQYNLALLDICKKNLSRAKCEALREYVIEECESSDCVDRVEKDPELSSFLGRWFGQDFTKNSELKNLAGVKSLKILKEKAKKPMALFYKAHDYLTRDSFSIRALLKAQFIHADWTHLMGNMLFILAFGVYLEQRVGPLAFLLIYFLGGTLGLGLQVFTTSDPSAFILGASANASALVGAFYFLFLKRDLLFLASLIFYNRIVRVPVVWSIPIIFVAKDLSEWILSWQGDSGVANLAHLFGTAVGGAIALYIMRKNPLRTPLVYPFEEAMIEQIKAEPEYKKRLSASLRLLHLNPENYEIIQEMIRDSFIYLRDNPFVDPPKELRKLFTRHFAPFVAICLRRGEVLRVEQVLIRAPKDFRFINYCRTMGQVSALTLADHFLRQRNWFLAIKFYDVFLVNFKKSNTAAIVRITVKNVILYLKKSVTNPTEVEDPNDHRVAGLIADLDLLDGSLADLQVLEDMQKLKIELLPMQAVSNVKA